MKGMYCSVGSSYRPGLAPAGDLLFFESPKKPKEKKGDPMVWEFLGSEPKFAEPSGSPCGCVAKHRSEMGV